MINSKVFLKGLKSLQGSKSPAIPLAACFVALGALLKDAGFNLQQSAASSLFTYALPGQLSNGRVFISWCFISEYIYSGMVSKL